MQSKRNGKSALRLRPNRPRRNCTGAVVGRCADTGADAVEAALADALPRVSVMRESGVVAQQARGLAEGRTARAHLTDPAGGRATRRER